MIFKKITLFLCLCSTLIAFSQDEDYSVSLIPTELRENANAVLRIDDTKIEISSIKNYKHSYRRVVTILNKNGDQHYGAYLGYDKSRNINKLSAIIYDSYGEVIKKVRRSDFVDVSAVSDFSLYEDSRIKYLDYTPTSYPYTIEFLYEVSSQNTAYIPFWRPIEGYYISTEKSDYQVIYNPIIGVNKKERNISEFNIEDKSLDGKVYYKASNIPAIKREAMSPSFRNFSPKVFVSPKNFHYEGYKGKTEDWKSLGKWIYEELLAERNELPESTKNHIKNLVSGIDDPIERAKIVYNYVQENTRYISVQVGIGGIQPIPAMQVDKVKYGDCKGLTNYTKALLDAVGVKSNYTEVYGSLKTQDVDKEFPSLLGQANHVILNIPNGEESIWLECTSQKVPFGHIANFTDDRDVLVITEEGGEIEHTKTYSNQDSYLNTNAKVELDAEGMLIAEIESKSGGVQYDDKLDIIDLDSKDRNVHYKKYWDYVNDISIENINIDNNRDTIEITEKVKLNASNYTVKAGDKLLVNPNIFNRVTSTPPRYTNRKLPFAIQRGFLDNDQYTIALPEGYRVEALPEAKEIKTKYGTYTASLELVNDSEIIYKRTLEMHKGHFPKEEYKAYRSFRRKIAKADKSSFVLVKK